MTTAAMKSLYAALAVAALAVAHSASAAIVITEVDPFGSNGSDGYSEDWFELTNTGSSAVSIAGWTMVDNHAASNSGSPYAAGATIAIGSNSAAALTLAGGATSLAAGQSAIILEASASAANSGTLFSNFETAWFGGAAKAPAGLLLGTYNDAVTSFGLSQTADMVNIFSGSSSTSALVASVAFGADTANAQGKMATFDNTAGLNAVTLSQPSVIGVNGAFLSSSGLEVGSPGTLISPVPLPATDALLLSGLALLGVAGLRRRAAAFRPAFHPA